jgi:hypothetical protein
MALSVTLLVFIVLISLVLCLASAWVLKLSSLVYFFVTIFWLYSLIVCAYYRNDFLFAYWHYTKKFNYHVKDQFVIEPDVTTKQNATQHHHNNRSNILPSYRPGYPVSQPPFEYARWQQIAQYAGSDR